MYSSCMHDHCNSYCYASMEKSTQDCQSPEFRARSQTWGGTEIAYRSTIPELSPQQYTCCYDSLSSNKDMGYSTQGFTVEEDNETSGDSPPKGGLAKKTLRKNPWGQETYADLIEGAINSHPTHMATLQQIYDYISRNYKYFSARSDPTSSAGWKNSIRHNLSLHDKFLKCPKKNENTKSSLWSINENSIKRARSNSMDCKLNRLDQLAKRKQLKEQKRSSTSNSTITNDNKRSICIRSLKTEKILRCEDPTMQTESNEENFKREGSEFLEIDSDHRYMPPDISTNPIINERDQDLHKDLQKLEMNPMEQIYNCDYDSLNYECSHIPDFHIAAMEYSKFVAQLFLDDLE